MENNSKTWLVYKHTLILDCESKNKSYIGITSTSTLQRWKKDGSGYKRQVLFYNAIQKYGWENFSHEILEDNIKTLDEANEKEIYWISYYCSFIGFENAWGYNMTAGGDGTKGRIWSDAERLAMSLLKTGGTHAGVKCSEEKKQKLRNSNLGKKHNISIESHKRMSKAKLGIHHTEEYNNNLSKKMGGKDILCVETGKIYHGGCAVFRLTGIRHVTEVCSGHRQTAGGYHWRYIDNDKNNRDTTST